MAKKIVKSYVPFANPVGSKYTMRTRYIKNMLVDHKCMDMLIASNRKYDLRAEEEGNTSPDVAKARVSRAKYQATKAKS